MSRREAAAEEAVAREIRHYLDAHPEAADTIDGVMQWWLSPATATASPETVRRALDRLVAAEEIVSRVLVDGAIVYGRR